MQRVNHSMEGAAARRLLPQIGDNRSGQLLPHLGHSLGIRRMQMADGVMHQACVDRGQFGQSNRGGTRQADWLPVVERHIRGIPRGMGCDAGDQQVRIAAYKNQTGAAFLRLKVREGKLDGDNVADLIPGHRLGRPARRPRRTARLPTAASRGPRHRGRSTAACPCRAAVVPGEAKFRWLFRFRTASSCKNDNGNPAPMQARRRSRTPRPATERRHLRGQVVRALAAGARRQVLRSAGLHRPADGSQPALAHTEQGEQHGFQGFRRPVFRSRRISARSRRAARPTSAGVTPYSSKGDAVPEE